MVSELVDSRGATIKAIPLREQSTRIKKKFDALERLALQVLWKKNDPMST